MNASLAQRYTHSSVFHDKANKLSTDTTFKTDFKPHSNCRRHTIFPPDQAIIIPKHECYLKIVNSATKNSYRSPHQSEPGQIYTEPRPKDGISNAFIAPDKKSRPIPSITRTDFQPLNIPRQNTHVHLKDSRLEVGSGPFDPTTRSEYVHKFNSKGMCSPDSQGREKKLCNLKSNIISGERNNTRNKMWTSHYKNNYCRYSVDKFNSPSRGAVLFQKMTSSIPQGDPEVFRPVNNHSVYKKQYHDKLTSLNFGPQEPMFSPAVKDMFKESFCYRDYNTFKDRFTTINSTDFPCYVNGILSPLRAPTNSYPWSHASRSSVFRGESSIGSQPNDHSITRSSYLKPSITSYIPRVDNAGWNQSLSNVQLGRYSHKPSTSHWTTMKHFYPPYTKPTQYKLMTAPKDHVILLKHYPNQAEISTMADSYQNNGGCKVNRKSHHGYHSCWTLPSMGQSSYLTTHNESFEAPKVRITSK